eukprot:SAG22_NODE_2185_length_2870_cov_1.692891_4_plen_132_part_00
MVANVSLSSSVELLDSPRGGAGGGPGPAAGGDGTGGGEAGKLDGVLQKAFFEKTAEVDHLSKQADERAAVVRARVVQNTTISMSLRVLAVSSKALSSLVLPLELCLRQCFTLPSVCHRPGPTTSRRARAAG